MKAQLEGFGVYERVAHDTVQRISGLRRIFAPLASVVDVLCKQTRPQREIPLKPREEIDGRSAMPADIRLYFALSINNLAFRRISDSLVSWIFSPTGLKSSSEAAPIGNSSITALSRSTDRSSSSSSIVSLSAGSSTQRPDPAACRDYATRRRIHRIINRSMNRKDSADLTSRGTRGCLQLFTIPRFEVLAQARLLGNRNSPESASR